MCEIYICLDSNEIMINGYENLMSYLKFWSGKYFMKALRHLRLDSVFSITYFFVHNINKEIFLEYKLNKRNIFVLKSKPTKIMMTDNKRKKARKKKLISDIIIMKFKVHNIILKYN